MYDIFLKRIYEPAVQSDETRILIDRLWPRGVTKEKANLTYWMKEIAPSHELRSWFHHGTKPFSEFRERYLEELRTDEEKIKNMERLCDIALKGKVTLLYGAKEDPLHNQAVILREEIKRIIEKK